MKRILGLCTIGAMLAVAPAASAATFDWDGTTDSDWAGANWTVSATPGQVAADEFTGSGNAKIYNYMSDANADTVFNGDDTFNIGAGDVIDNFAAGVGNPGYGSAVPYFEDNTVVNITDGAVVKLYANLWLPTKLLDQASMTITDSTAQFTRGNNTGNALVLGDNGGTDTASLVVSNSSVTVNQLDSVSSADEGGDLQVFGSSTIDISNGSTLTVSRIFQIDDQSSISITDSTVVTAQLDFWDDGALTLDNTDVTISADWDINNSGQMSITGNTTVSAPYIRIDSNSAEVLFTSGDLTFSAANALRGSAGFDGDFNWVGEVGDGLITTTNNTDGTKNLGKKMAQGFFAIDGTRIDPTIDDTLDWTNVTNLDALAAELATLTVGGKYFVLGYDSVDPANNDMTLTLAPEPASLALIGIGGLLLAQRRRRS